jgi:hypothetical protein
MFSLVGLYAVQYNVNTRITHCTYLLNSNRFMSLSSSSDIEKGVNEGGRGATTGKGSDSFRLSLYNSPRNHFRYI